MLSKAKELGISLQFLPTYSPNLNLIERFWKHVKKVCLTNFHHVDFASFRQAAAARRLLKLEKEKVVSLPCR